MSKEFDPVEYDIEWIEANKSTESQSESYKREFVKFRNRRLAAAVTGPRLTSIRQVQCGITGVVAIAGVATRIAPRDENDLQNVTRRGYKVKPPSMCLHMFMKDDEDEIFCKIDRLDFERLARPVIDRGKPGKSLYGVKGTVPSGFRMIKVKHILYLGVMS
jgi:hypothetical protein